MTYDFSSTGFPRIFSEMIGRAVMSLPPLIRENDDDFLTGMSGKIINAFWMEYFGSLPYEIQNDLLLAMNDKNEEAVLDWYAGYANFAEDENARELATLILSELTEALPELIKEEYDAFHGSNHAIV